MANEKDERAAAPQARPQAQPRTEPNRADPRNADPLSNPQPTPFADQNQIATPPTSVPFIDTIRVKVTHGPWAGSIYHLPNADAAQAITDKWAVDYVEAPTDHNAELPPDLTAEEQAAAVAAAEAYVAAQAEPPADSPEGETGLARRTADEKKRADQERTDQARNLQPGRGPGPGYETRGPGARRE
jgi:hypothetical protein